MKALLNSSQLAKQLKKVSPVMGKNTVLPILTSVLLDFKNGKLTLQATDLETTIHTKMDANFKQDFKILIDYHDLSELCSKLPNQPVFIEETEKAIVITADTSKFKFSKGGEIDSYPLLPEDDFVFEVDVNDDFFWGMACANVCKSNDDLNVRMTGVCVDAKKDFINIVGTNAFVAFKKSLPVKTKKSKSVIVCDKFIQLVKSFADAKLFVGNKFLKVDTDEITIVTRLIDAPFVEYEFVYPKEQPEFNFIANRKDMLAAIGLASIGSSANTRTCVIKFEGDTANITGQDVDFGKEGEAKLKFTGGVDFDEIGLNATQISLLLNLFSTEDVEILFSSPQKPVYVRPAGDNDTLCLIMPVFTK